MIRLVGIAILLVCTVQLATPVQAASYDGVWVGNVTCNGQYIEPQPWPLTVTVTGGAIAASTPNASGAGVIAGNRVTFTLATIGNAAHFTGTVHGRTMSGTYVQMGSGPCTWSVTRGAGTDAAQIKSVRPSKCRGVLQSDGTCLPAQLTQRDVRSIAAEMIRRDPDLRNARLLNDKQSIETSSGRRIDLREIKDRMHELYRQWRKGFNDPDGNDERVIHCLFSEHKCAVTVRG